MSMRYVWLLSLTLVSGLAADGRLRAQEPAGPAAEAEVETAPVVLDGAVLLRVRGVSSFPAPLRARAIQERLRQVAADRSIAPESLRVLNDEGLTRIVGGSVRIMSVAEADSILEQVPVLDLSETHMRRFREAVIEYRAARTPAALRRSAVRFLAATLILAITVVLMLVFWRWLERMLARRLESHIHTVEIRSFTLMRSERIWSAVRSGLLALRTILFLATFLVYLGFTLAQFPWTRGLSQDLVAFALEPLQVIGQGIVANIPSLVFLTVLFFVVRLVLRLVRLFFESVGRRDVTLARFDPEWAEPTYNLVRIAIVAFALIVAYPYIPGSSTAAFRGVSLFIGVIFSLGSSTAIANMVAGYMLTYRRALKVGNRVQIGNTFGDVIETRLQVTHVRSVKNEEIIIPNSLILAVEVVNYSSLAETSGLILHTEVGIGYETPWRQVEAMLLAAAERTAGLSSEPRPFILLKRLGDFAVTYELNVYCNNVKAMGRLYTELHRNILDVFNEYGVQIMTPAYEGDPHQAKVVPRENWYAAPAARQAERDRSHGV
jgi:small-conductance mechanosensitive channel